MTERTIGPALIQVDRVTKSFGAVRALRGVSLQIRAGEVHGLVGANGAGKSTLLNVLGGVVQPDSGTVVVAGEPVTIRGPRRAAELGLSFIHQELFLVPDFSAFDNMILGLPSRSMWGMRDAKERWASARAIAEELDLSFDLERPVKELSVAERGLVAIGRALMRDASFVAMDEPTAALSDRECERLFRIIAALVARGVAIAYVSHRLDEILELCDAVTVFRNGEVTSQFGRGDYTQEDLVQGITGGATIEPLTLQSRQLPRDCEPVLQVIHLCRPPRVRDVSFVLHQGEILGLAGLVGSGRTEVARVAFGADRATGGSMTLRGRPYRPSTVTEAIAAGVALVPEERRSQALVMDESVRFNISMGNWRARRWMPWLPLVKQAGEEQQARTMAQALSITMRDSAATVRTLSGGNQQKVVFGRWLSREPSVLLLDEPTRGVDVGARRQIWETVESAARRRDAVLVVSSELDELAICHRVVVIVEGRDVAVLEGPGVTEDQILSIIYANQKDKEAS